MCEIINEMISENEVILLDTSVAMDDNFENLVEKMEMTLLESKKKVIVKTVVWSELLRHLGSGDAVKLRRATKAVELIGLHRNLFEINDSPISEEQIVRAFADAEFLAELTLNKRKYRQALLTNDKKLSRDASRLNMQESCLGKQISIYNLDLSGNISLCEVSNSEIEEKVDTQETKRNEQVSDNSGYDGWEVAGISIISLAAGVIAGKYGKEIVKFIRKVIA